MTTGWRAELKWYVGAVIGAGWALLALLVVNAAHGPAPTRLAAFVTLSLLLIVSEQYPITIHRRGGADLVNLSGIFACALVLQWPIAWAVLGQVVGSLLGDARSRRGVTKALFNGGQYCLALATAGLIAHSGGYGRPDVAMGTQILVALCAGFTFFLLNNVLTGVAIALASREPLREFLVADLAFQASVNGAITVLAPVVIAAADQSVWLIPLLLVPAIAVYRAAHVSLEKEHRARHDHLTDLPNRFLFTETLKATIDTTPHNRHVAVIVMDLDSFKELNDTLGHAAGDELLRQVGPRLRSVLPANVMLARFGGDEFAILADDLGGVEDATALAGSVIHALEEPFQLESTSIDLHASLGLAMFPAHGDGPESLLQHADIAMYVAKRNRSGVEIYASERNQHSRRRLTILNELRPALTRGELTLHYQPQVDMQTGMASGMEALLRWHHPELGNVSPGEFIILAEQSGFVRQLSEFVLVEAIQQQHAWRAQGIEVPVSVNLSAHVLREPALLRRMLAMICESGLPRDALVVELTESSLMSDPDQAGHALAELADTGVRLSIDDFGVGYSALSYLSRLPVAELKIDRSFVTHIDSREANQYIVEAITTLARKLGISVVGEGIERVAEWQTMARLGCDIAQGFLISRALPADEITSLLASGEPLIETFAMTFGVDAAVHA